MLCRTVFAFLMYNDITVEMAPYHKERVVEVLSQVTWTRTVCTHVYVCVCVCVCVCVHIRVENRVDMGK